MAVPHPRNLTFRTNVRKRVGAKDGYYGNCITIELLAGATSGMVAKASIVELVRMIKCAKDQLGDNVNGSCNDGDQLMEGLRRRYDVMHMASWRNMGLEQVDFGSGAPARVMFHARQPGAPVPTYFMYPSCKGKDGVKLLSLAVKEEHADVFLGELEN